MDRALLQSDLAHSEASGSHIGTRICTADNIALFSFMVWCTACASFSRLLSHCTVELQYGGRLTSASDSEARSILFWDQWYYWTIFFFFFFFLTLYYPCWEIRSTLRVREETFKGCEGTTGQMKLTVTPQLLRCFQLLDKFGENLEELNQNTQEVKKNAI